jgi:predicted nucleic acid-binding protein
MFEIIDTVYLIAYLKPDDEKHEEALKLLSELSRDRKVSQAALVELDLLMKSRGFSSEERGRVWSLLGQIIPKDFVEALIPIDFAIAVKLHEERGLDYFDALIVAQCISRNATPITTDTDILKTVKDFKSPL